MSWRMQLQRKFLVENRDFQASVFVLIQAVATVTGALVLYLTEWAMHWPFPVDWQTSFRYGLICKVEVRGSHEAIASRSEGKTVSACAWLRAWPPVYDI